MSESYDLVIVGTGPAGLGAAFTFVDARPKASVLLIDSSFTSTGGLCNDCKMNFTFPIGFPLEHWDQAGADRMLEKVSAHLQPQILPKKNLGVYARRAEKLGVQLLEVRQSHLGTDGGVKLVHALTAELRGRGAALSLGETVVDVRPEERVVVTDRREIGYGALILAPGRRGFAFLQTLMDRLEVPYVDNVVDIGLRLETRAQGYPIVADYYDPKFLFPQ